MKLNIITKSEEYGIEYVNCRDIVFYMIKDKEEQFKK